MYDLLCTGMPQHTANALLIIFPPAPKQIAEVDKEVKAGEE